MPAYLVAKTQKHRREPGLGQPESEGTFIQGLALVQAANADAAVEQVVEYPLSQSPLGEYVAVEVELRNAGVLVS